MPTNDEIDPVQSPLDPDATQTQPPLTGTVDDNDSVDDERWDENEAPLRSVSDRAQTLRDEFQLDEREEEPNQESADEAEDGEDNQ